MFEQRFFKSCVCTGAILENTEYIPTARRFQVIEPVDGLRIHPAGGNELPEAERLQRSAQSMFGELGQHWHIRYFTAKWLGMLHP
jgi:hypothetical protein